MNKKKHIHVVAAVVEHEGRVLCVQRGATRYAYTAHRWEFPGGKVEPGETEPQALARELREELELDIEPQELITIVNHEYPDFCITMAAYRCQAASGEPRFVLREHRAALWLLPSQLDSLDWAAADKPIVEQLMLEGNQ
jgi:8-oxo-dGTP diphosphatase